MSVIFLRLMHARRVQTTEAKPEPVHEHIKIEPAKLKVRDLFGGKEPTMTQVVRGGEDAFWRAVAFRLGRKQVERARDARAKKPPGAPKWREAAARLLEDNKAAWRDDLDNISEITRKIRRRPGKWPGFQAVRKHVAKLLKK